MQRFGVVVMGELIEIDYTVDIAEEIIKKN